MIACRTPAAAPVRPRGGTVRWIAGLAALWLLVVSALVGWQADTPGLVVAQAENTLPADQCPLPVLEPFGSVSMVPFESGNNASLTLFQSLPRTTSSLVRLAEHKAAVHGLKQSLPLPCRLMSFHMSLREAARRYLHALCILLC